VTPPVLAVAHRAGNSLPALRDAVALGVDVIECDVHDHRGRLEVRHLKSAGPLPFLWDRWELVPASAPRLVLEEVLQEVVAADARGITFMLDLKGARTSAARALATALHDGGHHGPVLVCSRFWRGVDVVGALPYVLPVLSARTGPELALLRRRLARSRRAPSSAPPVFGVSLHLGLLEPDVVAELRRAVARVLTWPVNDLATLDAVLDLGVNGVTSDEHTVLAELVRRNASGG
jgi:hypothetical protein